MPTYAKGFNKATVIVTRTNLGATRGDIGALINETAQKVFYWETGVETPSERQANKLAAALQIPLVDIYFDIEVGGVPVV